MFTTLDDLITQVTAFSVPPVAFEALWDGDTQGWFLVLFAIIAEAETYTPLYLTTLQDGGDLRLFNGHVPPWPEAERARDWGTALSTRFGVPFHFPSPAYPEDDCPRWWEVDQATPCGRCGILLLQDADCPWAGRCYHCHLAELREQREAAWTPEQRAGPRCRICGAPAPAAPDRHTYCMDCREKYHWYACRQCGVRVMVARSYWDGDDRCPDCCAQERLAALSVEQRAAIRQLDVAKGWFPAAHLVEEVLHCTFSEAQDVVRALQSAADQPAVADPSPERERVP